MKNIALLFIFAGLIFSVNSQEEPKNLKDAMDASKARWLIGEWEKKNAEGENSHKQYKWGIQDSVILVHSKTNREYHGVVGFESGKVIGKYFGNNVVANTEWSGDGNGKLIEIVKMRGLNNNGELMEFNYGRVINPVDGDTFKMLIYQISETGELGEVMKNPNTGESIKVQTWKRKK